MVAVKTQTAGYTSRQEKSQKPLIRNHILQAAGFYKILLYLYAQKPLFVTNRITKEVTNRQKKEKEEKKKTKLCTTKKTGNRKRKTAHQPLIRKRTKKLI